MLAAPGAASARDLRELAGLAAQFGWAEAAVAVEGLGAALLAGAGLGEWTERIAAVLEVMT